MATAAAMQQLNDSQAMLVSRGRTEVTLSSGHRPMPFVVFNLQL